MIERDEVYRIKTLRRPGKLAEVLTAISKHNAQIGEIATISITPDYNIREIVVIALADEDVHGITESIKAVPGVEIVAESIDRAFNAHRGGKLRIEPDVEVRTLQDMREIYTPGVARVCTAIAEDESLADTYTWRGKTIAIVTDGSRVLGLGNIGPKAALPVMEGKALFYAKFVGLNAIPIVLDTQDPDEIIETVIRIAPGFGGIHLEDIASPGVYRVEEVLENQLDVPVFHDDQHGTAVVLMGSVLSAARLLDRRIEDMTFGQIGLGAAGSAIAHLARQFPFRGVNAFDPAAAAAARLAGLGDGVAPLTTTSADDGLEEVMATSDVVVLTTGRARLLSPSLVRKGQVIMALTNPVPEIDRHDALAAGAAFATDGSVVNNVLAYPGIFRGALDARAERITEAMKRSAAEALADLAPTGEILPNPLDPHVHSVVAERVRRASV